MISPRLPRRLLAALPTLAALACKSSSPSAPIETVELCGSGCVDGTDPLDKTAKTVGDHQTFAWAHDDLLPPSDDPDGSTQRLIWTPTAPHQVLAAFDTDYGTLSTPYYTKPSSWKFVAVDGIGNGKKISKTFSYASKDDTPAFHTEQIIRYDRGSCRNFASSSLVLNALAGLVDFGVLCGICAAHGDTSASETRESQDLEPSFTSRLDDIQHGVVLSGVYDGDAEVEVNPAYVFAVDSTTGRLSATAVALNVVTPDADVAAKVEAALKEQVARRLALDADPGKTNVLPFSNPLLCAQTGSITSQQASCSMHALQAEPGGSRAFHTLHEALLTDHADPEATTLADAAVAALTPRNFSCEHLAGDDSPQCVMHLVYKRVYMLPGQLEAVFADPGDTGLAALADAIGGSMLCAVPAGAGGSGLVPRLQMPSGDISGSCGACP
jgi:hypothetical protein